MNNSDNSRVNYSAFSEKPDNASVPETTPETSNVKVTSLVEGNGVTPDTESVSEIRKGVVFNCSRLNVRNHANATADVVAIIDAKTEVDILDEAHPVFYKIQKEQIVGFCMKQFISVE